MTAQNADTGWFVPPVDFLGELPKEAFDLLCSKANRTLLKAGEVLFRQGDAADYLYVVMSGTIAIFLTQPATGARQMSALVGKGEVIGEVAVVGGGNRSADVVALRDSDLLRIDQSDFERLVDKFPKIAFTVAKILAERFTEVTQAPVIRIHPKVISFIEASPGVDIMASATRMADLLHQKFGLGVHVEGKANKALDSGKLNELEDNHDLVILCAKPDAPRWMKRCTRQSDRICLITNANEDVYPEVAGQFLGPPHDHQMVDLYSLHENSNVCPRGTRSVVDRIAVNRYFHIRINQDKDWRRWARTLTGRGVGVVFSGGGARAYAHLGVLRALDEAHVPIDFVAGSSMGGIIAAGLAIGWSLDEMENRIRESFVVSNPLSDYTLPLLSLVSGRKVERLLRNSFGSMEISDLWLPYFCVSTNLTSANVHIHNKGKLCDALRASISLPGILPPVVTSDGVLVDGAAINNLPAIELSQHCHGPIIGVDVSRDLALHPEQWQSYIDRSFFHKVFRPPVIGLLLRSGTVSGEAQYRQQADAAHVNITPPLGEIDIHNWKKFDKSVELGYQHTMKMLESDPALAALKQTVL